jgi:hypothetical protein
MAITYEWKISQLDLYPTVEDHTDVVFNVHWRVRAVDGIYETFSYGTQEVSYDGSQPFVAYEDLTESMIIGWVKDSMGIERVADLEASLASNIEVQKNPPVVVLPLPWENAAAITE